MMRERKYSQRKKVKNMDEIGKRKNVGFSWCLVVEYVELKNGTYEKTIKCVSNDFSKIEQKLKEIKECKLEKGYKITYNDGNSVECLLDGVVEYYSIMAVKCLD